MNPPGFSLKPFPGGEPLPSIGITGTVRRSADALSIGYAIAGDLSELAIPPPAKSPERMGGLWEETCLEFFLGMKDSGRYWEFNLSPAGHWNVYSFASYRKDRREEPAFASLPFFVRTEPGAFRLSLDVDPRRILPAGEAFEVAVCAVLRTVTGMISHWALAHPGPRPDFHRKEGFLPILPAGR
ncbi:MAG: DOMON-like domain-containing protein [Deltaproteobacteria bacterium]|nr:DOMON-like domain-containing protein [Deltaproteobacteria bacterium]